MVSMNITTAKEERLTYEEWQAFLRKFEECTCTPGSALACPSCREYNRRKYGEECTCLPDLPDGRAHGHCYACEADTDEIPY